jgi:DNA-binding transcriptional ArsR family regulator
MTARTGGLEPQAGRTEQTVGDDEWSQEVLGLLTDPDSRAIVEATSEEPRSASELADSCGIALSTVYRKVNRLTEAGLLEERPQITPDGREANEFALRAREVQVDVTADRGVELTVTWSDSTDTVLGDGQEGVGAGPTPGTRDSTRIEGQQGSATNG